MRKANKPIKHINEVIIEKVIIKVFYIVSLYIHNSLCKKSQIFQEVNKTSF